MLNSGFTSHYLHKDSMSVQEESKVDRFGDSFKVDKPRNSARNHKGTKIRLHKDMASYKMNSNPSGVASDLQQTLATTAIGGGGISGLLQNSDFMEQEQARFNENMFNKRTKQAIRNSEKEKRMSKARSLQRENGSTLNKYYQEQIRPQAVPELGVGGQGIMVEKKNLNVL